MLEDDNQEIIPKIELIKRDSQNLQVNKMESEKDYENLIRDKLAKLIYNFLTMKQQIMGLGNSSWDIREANRFLYTFTDSESNGPRIRDKSANKISMIFENDKPYL